MADLSLGIIMDGNRRWARARNLPAYEGHMLGYEKLKDVLSWCREESVGALTVYAFSTENWNRGAEEVSHLMELFRRLLTKEVEKLQSQRVSVRIAGDLARFPEDLQRLIHEMHARNDSCAPFTLCVAASYGGRAEIVAAANAAMAAGVTHLDEATFAKFLWTHDMSDPDLIIRTGGEKRLSNFLPWQSVYTELFFSDTLWPDFTKEEFKQILELYGTRQRRRGL